MLSTQGSTHHPWGKKMGGNSPCEETVGEFLNPPLFYFILLCEFCEFGLRFGVQPKFGKFLKEFQLRLPHPPGLQGKRKRKRE